MGNPFAHSEKDSLSFNQRILPRKWVKFSYPIIKVITL